MLVLRAVTQPLHSMQRSASQINFIRAMTFSQAFTTCKPWSWFPASS